MIGNADSHPGDLVLVSHDATRTGAPRVALEILRSWASLHWHRHTILKDEGPLLSEFEAWSDAVTIRPARFRRSLWRQGGFAQPRRGPYALAGRFDTVGARRALHSLRPSLVYANTLVSADYAWAASQLGVPSILHCHELATYTATFARRYRLRRLPKDVSLVAVSTAARTALAEASGRDVDDIGVIPSPVDVAQIRGLAQQESPELVPQDALLVTGCGTVEDWKGPDLWLEMAKMVLASRVSDRAFFAWIGEGSLLGEMRRRARRMGLDRRVFFVGSQENPYPLLSRSAVFTLTSRWDSLSLVVLESMALGVPVVAFRVGGVAEGLGDCGILCPPGDSESMAANVVRLIENEAQARVMVRRGRQRVSALYDVSQFRSRIQDLVREKLSVPAGSVSSL